MKLILVVLLAAIVLSLAWGLSGLLRGTTGSRLIRSLTLRIGLSIGLFLLLILGAALGWWRPHQV
jgi:hypothetical protein